MTRTQTRELAFELLYSLEIQKVAKNEQTEQIQLFIEQQEIEEEKETKRNRRTSNENIIIKKTIRWRSKSLIGLSG
mgnify:CR=1 FL=1